MTTEAGRLLLTTISEYDDFYGIVLDIEAEARDMLAPVVAVTQEEDGSWSVEIAAMPGHVGAAMTITEAAVEAHDAALAWLEAHDAALLAELEGFQEAAQAVVEHRAGGHGITEYRCGATFDAHIDALAAVLDLIRQAGAT